MSKREQIPGMMRVQDKILIEVDFEDTMYEEIPKFMLINYCMHDDDYTACVNERKDLCYMTPRLRVITAHQPNGPWQAPQFHSMHPGLAPISFQGSQIRPPITIGKKDMPTHVGLIQVRTQRTTVPDTAIIILCTPDRRKVDI